MIFLKKRTNDITKAKPINPRTITESKSPEKVGAEKKLAAEPVKYHNYYGLGEDILLGIL
jgi:hypothetical protein